MKGYKPGVTRKDIEAHKLTNAKVRRTDTMKSSHEKALRSKEAIYGTGTNKKVEGMGHLRKM